MGTKEGQQRLGGAAAGRLAALMAAARAALWWERFWPAIAPALGLAGLFVALALLDVLPVLPGWLHGLILLALLAGFFFLAWRGLGAVRLPSAEQSRRRLELDSGLDHRPLASLDDTLTAGAADRGSAQLWTLHQQRLRDRLARLRVCLPRAGLAAIDPFALRAALGLLLFIGAVLGTGDAAGRLERALRPDWGALAMAPPAGLDVWINPPVYTGLPPLFLETAQGRARDTAAVIEVPAGSTVLAQVQGGRGIPSLIVGETAAPFKAVTLDAYKVSLTLDSGETLRVEQGGRDLAAWPLKIIPDQIPSIEFLSAPGRSQRAALRLEYRARDDYGLVRISGAIRRLDNPEAEPVTIELPLPGLGLRDAESLSFHDLTPHPWAGLAVEIRLAAEDALGQRGQSESIRTVLPERIFNHPVARALVELRKQLTLDPDARLPVVRALGDIYERPDHYFNDVVVALSLRSAERRLIHDRGAAAVPQVQQILWDTALHLEEGELATAERDLREIQQKLMQALARGADDAEIERLMDEMRAALDRFLEALAERLRDRMAQGEEPQPLPPNTQLMQSEDLRRLLDQAREMARNGARDAARDLLAQLQNMLENLRDDPFAQGMGKRSREAMGMMEDMEALTRQQQDLLDRSFERAQREDRGDPEEGDTRRESRDDARDQEALRRELGEMMRRLGDALGDIPGTLGRAERAMREARDALEGGESSDAVGPQTRALDQLQQGMRDMADRFMEAMGAGAPPGMGRIGAQPGTGRDPLGRQQGRRGFEALEGVRIPEEMELRRSREILDELRRRRGEAARPPLELDYIDRLLKQF